MAFGGLRGTLVVNQTSITNPTIAVGSVAVVTGDLVIALLVQQTALTVTGVTSSFVTTYTPLHAGTDAGDVTSRTFYGRVTSSGTLTAVNFACTASANNVAAMVAVIEGPFDVAPLDVNIANITSDAASPFTCPATGTLSQAAEFVVAWGAANYGTVWTSTAPNIELVEQASAALVKGTIGGQVVAATTTVTPVFAAASNPTQAILGTASFKKDLTNPRARDVFDRPPIGHQYPIALRTWFGANPPSVPEEPPEVTYILRAPLYTNPRAHEYHVGLRSWSQGPKPVTPVVQHVYRDPLYTNPRGHIYHVQLRTWLGRIPPPVAAAPFAEYDWPIPRGREYHVQLRTWFGKIPPAAAAPFAEYDWPNPRGHVHPVDVRTIAESFNLNLISQDQLPTGDIVTDRTPRTHDYHAQLRTWTWNYNLNLVGKDRLPAGEVVTDLPPRPYLYPLDVRTITASFNLNLTGQDRLPVGDIVTELARGYEHHVQLRSWTWNYNRNLIGQDFFPPGDELSDLPAQRDYPIYLRQWSGKLPPAVVAVPFAQNDWPTPRGYIYPRDLATLTESFNLNLIGQKPAGAIVTALARAAEHHVQLRTWTWNYNLNLIGKDQLPVGEIVTELTPRSPLSAAQLRTWINFASLALVTAPAAKPFAQYDWPVNFGPRWPIHIFTAAFNKNLIGQDKLPAGDIVTELPPRAPQQPIPIFTASFNKNLIGKDQLPVGAEITALPPQPALSANQLRTWINFVSLALVTPPAPKPFAQYDWPLNFGPRHPIKIFTAEYNKNLIGKDRLPAGDIVTDLPPRPAQQPTPIFVASYNKNLIGQDKLPAGAKVTDLPPQPPLRANQLRTWINTVNLALIGGPVVRPFAQYDWPLNVGPRQPTRVFTASYNRNLIGQDRLPAGDIHTALPAQQRLAAITWINTVNLALSTVQPKPFVQTDWKLPLAALQPNRSFTAFFNRNLIGQDRLPFRQQDWPLYRAHQQPALSYTAFYNRNLIGKDFLPFRQQDWPLTPDHRRLSDWIDPTDPNLFVPPPLFPPRTSRSQRCDPLYGPDTRPGDPADTRTNVTLGRRPGGPADRRTNVATGRRKPNTE